MPGIHIYLGGTPVSEDGSQSHAITFTDLSVPREVATRCDDGYTSAWATYTVPAGFDISSDNATWGASVTLDDLGDEDAPLYVRCLNYVKQGTPTLARISVEAADLTFLPVDYTFASTYFVNADITALVA